MEFRDYSQMIDPYKNMGFPDDFESSENKNTPEWCMKFAQAYWGMFVSGSTSTPYNFGERPNYNLLRLICEGNEPMDKIKEKLTIKNPTADPNRADTHRIAYTSISWENESVFPRYIETIMGILDEVRGTATVRAVDEAAFDERERMKWSIWEKSRNPFYTKLAKASGKQFIDDVPFVPADLNELETFATMGMELQHEVEIKDAMDRCFELSNWDDLSDLVKKDLLALSFCGVKCYYDRATKKFLLKYIDANNAILPKSVYRDYRDADTFGHIEYMSIHNLRNEMVRINCFKDEESFIEKLKKSYGAAITAHVGGANPFSRIDSLNSLNTQDRHGYKYDNFLVPVFFVERKTWNVDTYTKRKTKYRTMSYSAAFGYEPSEAEKKRGVEVDRKTYEMWYHCAWVVGTDMCIDWGPNEYVIRDKKGRAYSNYNFYRINNRSLAELAIPKIERITIACKKFQIAWSQAAPNGFMINWAALANITYGGKKLTEKEIMKVYLDTGRLFVNVDMNNPKKAVGFIVQDLPGGLGKILNDFIGTYNTTIQELNDITGITQPLLGAAPAPNQLNGVTQMSQQAAMSRLKPIVKAVQSIRKRSGRSIVSQIQAQAMFEVPFADTWYDINKNSQRRLRLTAEHGKYNYELIIEEDISQIMRQEILTTAKESAQRSAQGDASQITYSDYLLIVDYVERGKLIWARHLLERRLAKRAAIQQMVNMQNIEANAKTQEQSLDKQLQVNAALKGQETQSKIAIDDNKISKQAEADAKLMLLDDKLNSGEEKSTEK